MQRPLFFLVLAALALVGCGEEPSSSPEASPGNSEGGERLLNIGIEVEAAEDTSPDSLFLRVPGRGFWHADLSYGGTSDTFGYHPVGETDTFYVYPQGREGPSLEVPFTMQASMASGLASSKHYVRIYNDSIVVEGPALSQERLSFPRRR